MALVIRKRTNKTGMVWYVNWEVYIEGKRVARVVPPSQYERYALHESLTFEQARAVCAQFNGRQKQVDQETKRNRMEAKLKLAESTDVVHMPQVFCDEFLEERLSETTSAKQQKRIRVQWRTIRTLVKAIGVETWEWGRRKKAIYAYFTKKQFSLDYCKKLIALMNLWGEFLEDKQGKVFKTIKPPKGMDRQILLDAHEDANKSSKVSEPLTVDDIVIAKQTLTDSQWKWCHCTLWFGLRPDEMTVLYVDPFRFKVEYDGAQKVAVFYQPKKKGLARHKRWKRVPILFPEQEIALGFLDKEETEEPIPKTLKKHLKKRCHLYAGRKGFQDLMTSLGRTFFEIQDWLGHENVDRTWRDYRNRGRALIEKKTG